MNRTEKQELVDELRTKIGGATALYYTDFTGLNVKGMTELRRRLRKAGRAVRGHQEHPGGASGEREWSRGDADCGARPAWSISERSGRRRPRS